MDVLGPYPSSYVEGFDLRISDVKPEDLPGRISQALGVQYLADMPSQSTPVNGIGFNTRNSTLRVLVTLPVSARGQSVAVHFILTRAHHAHILPSLCWMHSTFQKNPSVVR